MDDALLDAVRRAANAAGLSVNRFITETLLVATSEDDQSTEAERMRHRLRAAGLLAVEPRPSGRRISDRRLAELRKKAGTGTPLSDIVAADRG